MSDLPICEIFGSIDGEGIWSGCLATFIRLAGCNLRCRYCDTGYAFDVSGAKRLSLDEIIAEAERIGYHHITLTGGEPLVHDEAYELIDALCARGYHVNVETNGSKPIERLAGIVGTTITMDWKCGASGMSEWMMRENIDHLRSSDVLKLVLDVSDIDDVPALLAELAPRCHVFLSPVFGLAPIRLVELLRELHKQPELRKIATRTRVQLQLHKIIWDPNERGV